jgi:hypothetical protein
MDTDLGPQLMSLKLFQAGPKQDDRIELNISILPRSGQADRRELFYAPYLSGKDSMPLDQIKIPVEIVLALAEENGGYAVRHSVNNDCEVRISLTAGILNDDWSISYESNGEYLMEIWVDEQTGKHKIISDGK